MPRTETTRRQYGPNNERCPGDVTDEDRAVVFPPLPGPDTLGRPRQVALRDVRDGIGSIAAAGCAWCLLPKAFPPVSTVRSCFHNRRDSGLPAQINHAAVAPAGERDAPGSSAQGRRYGQSRRENHLETAAFPATTQERGSRAASATS